MEPAPDRKKLRRRYLIQKAKAYGGALMCSGLLLLALLITLGFAVAAVIVLMACLGGSPLGYGFGAMIFGVLLIGSVGMGLFTWSLWQESVRFIQVEANLIPYAPPVTPDSLPADEILVRGAEEPTVQQSEILLRAAQEQDTATEELLRVSQGRSGE